MKDFTKLTTPDVHHKRRVEILRKYPQVKDLFGYDTKTAYTTIVLVLLQIAISFLVQNYVDKWWKIAVIAYCIGAVLNHWCAMAIHECSHNLAASTPLYNKIVALVANFPIVLPGAMPFCRYHQAHHAYLGIEGKDNDLPSRFELKWFGNSSFPRLAKFIWQSWFLAFQILTRNAVQKPTFWEVINVVTQLTVDYAIVRFIGTTAILYLLLSDFFGFGLHPVAGHYIHEHFTYREGQETYSYYGLLNKVTFNVGYHFEHHDTIGIPGSRLPEYRKITSEYYDDLLSCKSWTLLFVEFICGSTVGIHSRYIRDQPKVAKGQ